MSASNLDIFNKHGRSLLLLCHIDACLNSLICEPRLLLFTVMLVNKARLVTVSGYKSYTLQ